MRDALEGLSIKQRDHEKLICAQQDLASVLTHEHTELRQKMGLQEADMRARAMAMADTAAVHLENLASISEQKSVLASLHGEIYKSTEHKAELAKTIEPLVQRVHEYHAQLQQVHTYGDALKGVYGLVETLQGGGRGEYGGDDSLVTVIIETLERFVTWFEGTYNAKLHAFTCMLQRSQLYAIK